MSKKHTAAWRLFNVRYEVFIPRLFGYSKEYLESNSIPISGNSAIDGGALSVREPVFKTGAALAMFTDMGLELAPESFKYPDDSIKLYKDIYEHLTAWHKVLVEDMNSWRSPPIKDFESFDDLAECLHRYFIVLAPDEIKLKGIRGSASRFNRAYKGGGITRKGNSGRFAPNDPDTPYIRISDKIKTHMLKDPLLAQDMR